jgi:hypothetical protein
MPWHTYSRIHLAMRSSATFLPASDPAILARRYCVTRPTWASHAAARACGPAMRSSAEPTRCVCAYRCDGQLAGVVVGVQRPLSAISVDALAEIVLLIEQSYAHQRDAQIARGLEVVPGRRCPVLPEKLGSASLSPNSTLSRRCRSAGRRDEHVEATPGCTRTAAVVRRGRGPDCRTRGPIAGASSLVREVACTTAHGFRPAPRPPSDLSG